MRVVVDILLLLPAFAWQSALAGHFQVRGVGLDLLAVMLASISLNQGWLYGAIGGLICGVMMDSVFGMTGFYALQYMALGMLVGLFKWLKADQGKAEPPQIEQSKEN